MKTKILQMFLLGSTAIFAACTNLPAATPPSQPPNTTVPESTPKPTSQPSPTPDPLTQGTNGRPWWNDVVFYEVFVRSFFDSNEDGKGDLNGLIEKLDYLNDGNPASSSDLGVTGLWLMPITQSPSYHGYDVVDYFAVDDEYGTAEDFHRLIEEAHKRGIRVIIDLVLNHTSSEHPWFIASKDPGSDKRNWYIWADTDPGFRGPEGQQVWHASRSGYYYGVFWSGMPDLNYNNPEVTAQMEEAARFWLEEMKVDGFRLDAIKHLVEKGPLQQNTNETHAWLQGFFNFYKSVNPNALAVGEAWTSTQQVLDYTGDEVDIAFQFDLALAAFNSLDSGLSVQVGKAQSAVVEAFPINQYATFLTNHDQNRIMSKLDEDEGKARLAATWLLTSPGVPFIYYGEEIGMTGTKPDEDIRRPMQWCSDGGLKACFSSHTPWRFPSEDYETRSVALQDTDPDSLLNHYRTLIHLRNEHEALRVGNWLLVDSGARAYAYLRATADEVVLVLMNFDDEPLSNYGLSLEVSPLVAGMEPALLLGNGRPSPPDVGDNGRITDYKPFDTLPPHSSFIIAFP